MNEFTNHFVEKLRLKERAEEDIYFARRDRELLRHLHDGTEEEKRRRVRELARMRCPECGAHLSPVTRRGITVKECPEGHGVWTTRGDMRTLARRESASWISRYFYPPKPVV